jgi:hypothetical protein
VSRDDVERRTRDPIATNPSAQAAEGTTSPPTTPATHTSHRADTNRRATRTRRRRRLGFLALVGRAAAALAVVVGLFFAFRSSPHDSPQPTLPSIAAPSTTAAAPTPSSQAAPLAPVALRKYCHAGDVLKGVYRPARLTVKNPCVAVTGLVRDTNIEHDGDVHISLGGVDAKWLNAVNLKRVKHDLVVEIVPGTPIAAPPVNSRVTVVGPWVLDTETGWLEIHPAWAVIPAG